MAQGSPAEMVGATHQPITLGAAPHTAQIAIAAPSRPAQTEAAAAPRRRRVFLNLEHITSEGVPPAYGVYINLPDGADPGKNEQLMAGLVPTFGVREASRATDHHPGHGLHHALDITDIVERLQQSGQWDPQRVRVTFVPLDDNAGSVAVQVGRTSIYYK